jgi:hypothetical protein
MQRFFITAVNCVLLAVMLLGVPEIAGARFGHWQLSSYSAARTLTFWALAIAAAVNAGAAQFLVKGRKERHLGWTWAAIFAALWCGEFAYERGYFNFSWLKSALMWLQNRL